MKSKILIDNWSLEKIAFDITEKKDFKSCSDELCHIIEAILFWDDIYYIENGFEYFWLENLVSPSLKDILKPLRKENADTIIDMTKFQFYNKFASIYGDGVIAKGAIEYLLMSNYWNLDYFPSFKRNQFIQNNMDKLYKKFKQLCFSEDIDIPVFSKSEHKEIDRAIENYYQERDDNFEISMPAITEYVMDKAKSHSIEDILVETLRLREKKYMVNFRNGLQEISYSGNYKKSMLRQQIKYNISQLKKNIGDICTFRIGFELGKNPFEMSFAPFIDISLNFDSKPKYAINNVFLRKVLKNFIKH